LVSGLSTASAERLVLARTEALFTSTEDLARRAALDSQDMNHLARADALHSLSGHRRQQAWDASALHATPPLLREAPVEEDFLDLPEAAEGEEIGHDYAALGLSLRRHPMALLRPWLTSYRIRSAEELKATRDGRRVRAGGLVTVRQQPGTAKGTVFVTLEDETGNVNVIVWPKLRDAQRSVLLNAQVLVVEGRWQVESNVRHLVAERLLDITHRLGQLAVVSRDFH
jgi:error-prone DNA polymerase